MDRGRVGSNVWDDNSLPDLEKASKRDCQCHGGVERLEPGRPKQRAGAEREEERLREERRLGT